MRYRWLVFTGVLLLMAGILLSMAWRVDSPAPDTTTGTAGLGMMLLDSTEGVSVLAVQDGSLAERAGIHPTDLLTRLNGTPFASVAELETLLQDPPGADVCLYLIRSGYGMEICFPIAP